MISSKGIKILCYIIVGFSILISAILVLFGIQQATDKNQISIVLIILGVLIPLFTSISLYPIFALANIDENLHLLTDKVSSIEAKIHSNSNAEKEELTKKFKEETSDIEIIKSKTNTYKPKEKTNPQEKPSSLSNDTTNFINAKYNLNITSTDTLEAIKLKISTIQETSTSAKILMQKISNANDMTDVVSAFALHMAAHPEI